MFPVIVGTMLVLGILSFILGWTAASTLERRARRASQRYHRKLEQNLHNMGEWVRTNWPNEYAAYQRGVTEGYQQGVLHSPELVKDSESPT